MRTTHRCVAVLIGAFIALAGIPLEASASVSAPDLVGVWAGEQVFGPQIAGGEVSVTRAGDAWSAMLAGTTIAGHASPGSVAFGFGKGNELRVRLAGGALIGQWIQPKTAGMDWRFATPIAFSGPPAGPWRGRLAPLADVEHVNLIVQSAPDGTTTAFLRNPERNFGARIGTVSVTTNGDRVTLTRKGAPDINGTFDAATQMLSFHFDQFPGAFALKRLLVSSAPASYAVPAALGDGWKTGSLSDVGINEQKIVDVLTRLSTAPTSTRSPYIQSLLIARHGRLVLDAYFNGFDRQRPHDVRSAGKSVATLLVGAAMQDDPALSPSTTLDSLFPQYLPYARDDARKHRITVGDLMSMSSGLACDDNDDASPGLEDTMQSQSVQPDWYKFTLDLPLVADPGTKATYCSAGINLLGGVVTKATGRWLPDYFYDRFAKPMQFGQYAMWLTPAPLDTAYMAGGDYFLPRDFLKFGQLFLDRGSWNGAKVIDDAWLQASIAPRSGLNNPGDYGYGWHLLTYVVNGQTYKAFNAGGNGGQLLIVIPRLDMAIMITAANYGQYPVWQGFINDLVPNSILTAVQP